MRQLLLLRHAKSDGSTAVAGDFHRSLSSRGHDDAVQIGEWLQVRNFSPDQVMCSPALRARQTFEQIAAVLDLAGSCVHFDKQLYLADLTMLLKLLGHMPEACHCLLVIGHNPGLEDLAEYLAAQPLTRTGNGKLMTAAALVHLAIPGQWTDLQGATAGLLNLVRPCDLPAGKV